MKKISWLCVLLCLLMLVQPLCTPVLATEEVAIDQTMNLSPEYTAAVMAAYRKFTDHYYTLGKEK